jgi:hypothetical protein
MTALFLTSDLVSLVGIGALCAIAWHGLANCRQSEATDAELGRLGQIILDQVAHDDLAAAITELRTTSDEQLLAELHTYPSP